MSPANHVVITSHQQTISSQVCYGQLYLASCRQYLVACLPVRTPHRLHCHTQDGLADKAKHSSNHPVLRVPISMLPFTPYTGSHCGCCSKGVSGHLLQQVDINVIPVLSSAVKVVQSMRDLGVILDSQLLLSDHIAALVGLVFISYD